MNADKKWVPIEGGPTAAHVGRRVRLVSSLVSDCDIRDRVVSVNPFDREVRLVACGDNWYPDSGEWFVHRDDAPDSDADLIERMAEALYAFDSASRDLPWSETAKDGAFRKEYRQCARAALAVVRESEAGA